MNFENISVVESYQGQVATITLNTPPANILTAAMIKEINDFFTGDIDNKTRKLVIINGSGDNFCFGASVAEHSAEQVRDMLPSFHQMIGNIIAHPVATMAQVRGFCLGGGFELALACSFIFADDSARFAVPEIQLGVFPPVAAALLPMLGTGTLTNEMLLSGQKFAANKLNAAGIVTSVTSSDQLPVSITTYIEKRLLANSAASLRFAHRAARLALVNHYQAIIPELEKMYLDQLMATHDANEGINAFIAKRKPQWKDE
jgi:cyclohexa-1,5-dienecarbonyl-CoA hydratase